MRYTNFFIGFSLMLALCTPFDAFASAAPLGQLIDADDDALQKLKLMVVASPQTANNAKDIKVSITLSNPTSAEIPYPATNVFLADTGITIKNADGQIVARDHPLARGMVMGVRFHYLAPRDSLGDTLTLYDLGYDLQPGQYTLIVSHTGVAANVKPIYAPPVSITISR
jgi:hypothetical protein